MNTRVNVESSIESGREEMECSASEPDLFVSGDRHAKLTQLQALYIEAQKLAVRGQPHENLDWILGHRRDLAQDPFGFQTKTIELISLWLEDLIAELESPPSDLETRGIENSAMSEYRYRYAAAQRLRDATKVFLKLFGPLPSGEAGASI